MYAIKDFRQETAEPVTLTSKALLWAQFVHEVIFKEPGACIKHIWYRLRYTFNSSSYPLNPLHIESPAHSDQVAKVIICLHGSGGHKSCFIPLANTLKAGGFKNIYTVDLIQTDEDPIPTSSLEMKISKLELAYLEKGYKGIELTLVGHSLGALASVKYAWRRWDPSTQPPISFIASLGGRLSYLKSPLSWFCEDVRPEIEKTFEKIKASPDKARILAFWGENDALVPRKSAHLFENREREITIQHDGHSGIVFSPTVHQKILEWIKT